MSPGSRWSLRQQTQGMRGHLPLQTCLLRGSEAHRVQAASNPAARGCQTPVTLAEQIKAPIYGKSELTSLV